MRYIIEQEHVFIKWEKRGTMQMKNSVKYLKLVVISIGDFESEITFEKNYPSTDEGMLSLTGDMKKYEARGLICTFAERDLPVLT